MTEYLSQQSERLFIMKELGKIIAKNRKANKMKQGELAKKLEGYDIFVKQNTVSAWESGSTQPSARQLLAICELLVFHPLINSTF